MHSSSRSKPMFDRGLEVSHPEVPLLETEDLPADDDWGLMKSLAIDQDDVDNVETDTGKLTILSSDFE